MFLFPSQRTFFSIPDRHDFSRFSRLSRLQDLNLMLIYEIERQKIQTVPVELYLSEFLLEQMLNNWNKFVEKLAGMKYTSNLRFQLSSSSFRHPFSHLAIFFPLGLTYSIMDRFFVPGAVINFVRRSKCQSRSKIRMEVRSTCRICRYRRLYLMYFTLYISPRSYRDLLRCYLLLLLHRATTGSCAPSFLLP